MQQEQKVLESRGALSWMLLLAVSLGCGSGPVPAAAPPVVLRVGVGNIASDNPLGGVKQVASNQSFEGFVRYGADGHPRPWLAKAWNIATDRRSMTLELRPEARFHDGSPASGPVLAEALRKSLPEFLGSLFEDVDSITNSPDGHQIIIRFKRPSALLVEALEAPIKKPGAPTIGTGPFTVTGADSADQMRANGDYYLGPPTIQRIIVTSYPSTRAAWADLLRNKIDMLYEVSADAASSIQDATTISTFTFTRPYQYMVILNVKSPKLGSPVLRRGLNAAIDRTGLIRDAFDGRALEAAGLVWPQNWAYGNGGERAEFEPQKAADLLKSSGGLSFTCLVPTDYERIALVVQQQLSMVGVTMKVEPVAPDRLFQAIHSAMFDAVLTDVAAGPGLLRSYVFWHTQGSANPGALGDSRIDDALDRIRRATSDGDYKAAVANFQKVTIDDPPAIYLAWGQRSRAVSKRFNVPPGEPGRDVLSTLRLWKPSTDAQNASRN